MSDTAECGNCRFFQGMNIDGEGAWIDGLCRLRAPLRREHPDPGTQEHYLQGAHHTFPGMWVYDWCGKHKPVPEE